MIRSTLATIGGAISAVVGGGTAYMPPVPRPPAHNFLMSRQDFPYRHNVAGRLYYYRAPHAENTLEFRIKYRNDLFGYGATEAALTQALEAHYALFGPIREKYVVFQTGDWNGFFTIDENTDERTLILRLATTADERILATLPQMK